MAYLKLTLTVLLFSCLPLQAFAGLEFSGTYGLHTISPSDLNSSDQVSFGSSYPNHSQLTGYTARGIYYFPMDFGLGLKYEYDSDSVSGNGVTTALSASRVAPVVAYRLLNNMIYAGLNASYGIAHTMKMTITGGSDATTVSQQSYSVGAEGGVNLGQLILGLEAGYLSFLGKEVQQGGVDVLLKGSSYNIDLSGFYLNLVLGVGF